MKVAILWISISIGLLSAASGQDDVVAAPLPPAGPAASEPGAPSLADSGTATAPPAAAPEADPPAKPWRLPQPCFLKQYGVEVSGWLQQGVTLNTLSPQDGSNGPVVTNDLSNNYELNQLWLTFVRPVKTDGCGFDIGGRIDMIYGTDWRYGDCLGLESKIDYQHELYGLALPQFYVEVGYNDLTVKIGHYATLMGYEVVPGPGNFFYSHSYELGYAEPVLVTGVQADYKLNDNWSVNGGFNRGWFMFEDDNESLDFLGGLKWHNDANTTSVSFEIDVGPQDPQGQDNRYDYSLVVKRQLSKNWLYVAQHNMGGEPGTSTVTPGGYADWYGLAQYLIYTINKEWSAGTRIEWFRDNDGARVSGIGNLNYGWDAAPGFVGTFTEWTTGLNWRPNPNFVFRPEIRCDWYNGTPNLQGQLPFGDGRRSQQLLLAADMIVTF